MKYLNVWLETLTDPIGILGQKDDGDVTFAYSPEWLEYSRSHPLSMSLPLREEPFNDLQSRAYFDNLLLENNNLLHLMEKNGIERSDLISLLNHLGSDCSGAVSVVSPDKPSPKRPGETDKDYDPIDDEVFNEIVERLATNRPLPDEIRDPSAVAGVRPKVALTALPNGKFAFPKRNSGAPTTIILKIPDDKHPHEARDEEFATVLAAKCGMRVGTVSADKVKNQDILLIQRFDRVISGRSIYRLHQEDFAQAAGLPSSLKYERNGQDNRKFDATTVGRILSSTATPATARDAFLEMTLFNLLIGNNDNHAKNNAIIYGEGGEINLAPFYDIVPVQCAAGFTTEFAFKIGNASQPEELTKENLIAFCEAIGLPSKNAERFLYRKARDLIVKIESASHNFPKSMSTLDRLFGENAQRFNEILDLNLDLRERDAHVLEGGGWL